MAAAAETAARRDVIIIQHSDKCPPSYVTEFLINNAISYRILMMHKGDQLPAVDDSTAAAAAALPRCLIVLGGPQGAYETAEFTYLQLEINFIAALHALSIPVLGLCLGCQLAAAALGGRVYKAELFEVGYTALQVTDSISSDPVLSQFADVLLERSPFLMHHGDSYSLGPQSTLLAVSAVNNYNAAWREGNTLGVQFHPESSVTELTEWSSFAADRYADCNRTVQEVLTEATAKRQYAREATAAFFDSWWLTVLASEAKVKQ